MIRIKKIGRKGIKLRNTLLILLLMIIIYLMSWILLKNKQQNSIQEMTIKKLIKAQGDLLASTECTTYYIASNGTSEEGMNIDDPMSLEVANKKKFNTGDKILFKRGDTFYGQIDFSIIKSTENMYYIGNYGEGELPIISGAKVISKQDVWKPISEYNNIYRIDLTDFNNFEGGMLSTAESCNIGFIQDEQKNIYGSRKENIDLLQNEFDFCCDSTSLYIKCSDNPTKKLGKIYLATKIGLLEISSNSIVAGLKLTCTGAHAVSKKSYPISNIYIHDCVIENIGGSVLKESGISRYGNGIEFWLRS